MLSSSLEKSGGCRFSSLKHVYDGSNIHGMWGFSGLESTLASSVTAIVKKNKKQKRLNVFFQCEVLIKGDTGG